MMRVQFDQYGPSAAMYLGDFEPAALRRNQVRVRVRAAAVNPLDWKQRQGAMKLFMSREFPKGMGSDFSGVVEAVGSEVRGVQVGDEVLGTMAATRPGAFAEVLVTEVSRIAMKPSQLSFAEAACLPIPATTAWVALMDKGKLSASSHIMINGCTGAVGATAVQLAKACGAIIAGTCSAASMPNAKLAGIDSVFDYAHTDAWRAAGPFDVIFDAAGTLDVCAGLAQLKPKGRFVDINPTPGRLARGMLSRRYKLAFATMGTKHLAEIAELAGQGKLQATIGAEHPLSEAVETIIAVEKGQRVLGRVVLNC